MPDPDNIGPDGREKDPLSVEDIFDFEKRPGTEAPEARPEAVPEKPPEVTKEGAPEAAPERKPEAATEDEAARRKYAPPPAAAKPAPPVKKSEDLVKIESILSEHLDDLFMQMTPQQQMAFKQKGEESATKIEKLLQQAKVRVNEVLSLIKDWLKMIPGINKFFLEQEAKIKTDRIINVREQKRK